MAFKKKNLRRSNKVVQQKSTKSKKVKSLKKKIGGCNPTTVDCLNPNGISQMGVNPYESPPTVSEQAFDHRYFWSGNEIAGSAVGKQVGCPTEVKEPCPIYKKMSGGKKQKKRTNNNKSLKKKKGGGVYLNLAAEKIGNQAVVSGYDDCYPPSLKEQYKLI